MNSLIQTTEGSNTVENEAESNQNATSSPGNETLHTDAYTDTDGTTSPVVNMMSFSSMVTEGSTATDSTQSNVYVVEITKFTQQSRTKSDQMNNDTVTMFESTITVINTNTG